MQFEDIATRTSIGIIGSLATIGLDHVSQLVSIAVGCATFVYMVCSITKLVRNWNNK